MPAKRKNKKILSTDKRFPEYEGEFTGEFIHSKDYKKSEELRGKRVLVIGGGNSACDVVSEAARVVDEAHLSLRLGYWFLPKTLFGKPSAEPPAIYFPLFFVKGNFENNSPCCYRKI